MLLVIQQSRFGRVIPRILSVGCHALVRQQSRVAPHIRHALFMP